MGDSDYSAAGGQVAAELHPVLIAQRPDISAHEVRTPRQDRFQPDRPQALRELVASVLEIEPGLLTPLIALIESSRNGWLARRAGGVAEVFLHLSDLIDQVRGRKRPADLPARGPERLAGG